MTTENGNVIVRNIAQISCVSKDEGVLCAVRGLVSHRGKLYFERKDNKDGDYVYSRLQPKSSYALRPFEFEDVTSENLNQWHKKYDEHCIHLLNVYSLEVCDRMYHRLSKRSDRINVPMDTMVDYISISYYNPKRVSLNEQYGYTQEWKY